MQLVLLLVPLHLLQGNSQATTKQDGHLITAKQALSAGEYAKAIDEATASIKNKMLIMEKPILYVALQQH